MMKFRTIDELDVAGKRVLVRADFNVPMKDGQVTDRSRIERGALTISQLARRGAKVAVLSHFGRPNGKPVPEMSLRPLAAVLSQALGGQMVAFVPDCIGSMARMAVSAPSMSAAPSSEPRISGPPLEAAPARRARPGATATHLHRPSARIRFLYEAFGCRF